MVFVSATALLSLCILTTGMVLHDIAMLVERARQAHYNELNKALPEEKKVEPVFVSKKKRTLFCEKCSLISLVVSLILLVVYTALITI
jgi:hypothetical protein